VLCFFFFFFFFLNQENEFIQSKILSGMCMVDAATKTRYNLKGVDRSETLKERSDDGRVSFLIVNPDARSIRDFRERFPVSTDTVRQQRADHGYVQPWVRLLLPVEVVVVMPGD